MIAGRNKEDAEPDAGAPVEEAGGPPAQTWAYRLAVGVTLLTLFTIVVGAQVTTKKEGDVDPTWVPWRLFNIFLDAVGKLFYEINHRRLGSILGLFTIALMVVLWRTKERRLARIALVAVVLQGLIGGIRILTEAGGWVQDWVMEPRAAAGTCRPGWSPSASSTRRWPR